MSGLFGGHSSPPPPPPPVVPPTPVMPDTQSPQVLEAQQIATSEALRRSGRRSTMLGDTSVPAGITAAYAQGPAGAGRAG